MDYEKKYKETLERAKQLLGTSVAFDRFTIERIFPELKESEDEKIRKEFCKDIWTFIPNEKAHKYIAWLEEKNNKSVNLNKLEKQVSQKPTEWSEDDERNIQNIDSVLFYDRKLPEDTRVKLRDFLKTLKERIEG